MALSILRRDQADAELEALSRGEWEIVDHFDRGETRYIVAVRETRGGSRSRSLTSRQAAVVSLVARGYSNKRVAYDLGLAVSTVAVHVATAMHRWGVTSRVALVGRWNLLAEVQQQTS